MKLFYKNRMTLLSPGLPGLILSLVLLINASSYSQGNDEGTNVSLERKYSEELYIKTDRDLYIAGEKVWLKIYKLNGLSHTPSDLSKVIYTDILDTQNNLINQLKTGIAGCSGSASFRLPDTLATGNYIIRSYTSWMQNFPRELFSYKSISVINPFESISNFKIPAGIQIPDSVTFAVEGGRPVAGLKTRIGFKTYDRSGNPVSMTGALIYDNNDTICYVRSGKDGYGWASLIPPENRKILLVTTNKTGPVKTFSLPETRNEGITLSVSEKNENSPVLVKILRSNNFNPEGKMLNLVLVSADLITTKREISFKDGFEVDLLRAYFPRGLSYLTIADNDARQLTNRWIYNDIEDNLTYQINIQNIKHFPREEIKLSITATDSKGVPVESDFSISVAKRVTVNDNSYENVVYRQLPQLATISDDRAVPDINGYLLFNSSHDMTLDEDFEKENYTPSHLPESEGHLIRGNIKSRISGEPLSDENITLSYVGMSALCQFAVTNKDGNFTFVTRERGLKEIVIQPLSSEKTDCYVELKNPFNTSFDQHRHELLYIDTSKTGDINNAVISMQINNIYEPFFHKPLQEVFSGYRPDFYGKPDKTILMSNYIELTSLKEVVRELIPNVAIVRENGKANFRIINRDLPKQFEKGPLVMVDGVPVYVVEKILNINARDLERIDIMASKYYIAGNTLEGIIHFVTKKGNLGVLDPGRSVFRQAYELPLNDEKFYSPDYSSVTEKDNRIPDFRNTLYWNPSLRTDKSGNATIGFYASDESARYTITVEGISPEGKRGATTIPLTVINR